MAVVDSWGLWSYNEFTIKRPPQYAPGIDEIYSVGILKGQALMSPNMGSATFVDNTPISFLPQTIYTGAKRHTFADDYYNRIHITPTFLNLGNLLSSQQRNIEVWNSYFTPQLLSSIGQVGADGIVLSQPIPAPTTFAELETRTYIVNISTNGAPVINAQYIFNFPLETPEVRLIGRRVVVWPFLPQVKFTEGDEWKTDIIPSFEYEQRLALRTAPRQSFGYQFQLDAYQFSKAKAIATQWGQRVYGIPVWAENTFVGAIPIGATKIFLDTAYADYRDDDIIMVWDNDVNFAALEILVVDPDGLNLKLPTEVAFNNAYVSPLRFAQTPRGIEFKRDARDEIIANANFVVTQNVDLGAGVGYPVYKGIDVIPDRTIIVSDISERILRAVDTFDNGSGPVVVDIQNNWVTSTKQITFDTLTREDRWSMRQWVHSRRGRQKAFCLPSWNMDLNIIDNLSATSTVLTIQPIGYGLYYGITYIRIEKTDGTVVYNTVIGSTLDISGNELLTLEDQLGVDLLVSEVRLASFMSHVRFDSDNVRLSFTYDGRSSTSIPVVETPILYTVQPVEEV